MEIIKAEEQKEKWFKKSEQSLGTYGTALSGPTYASQESQKKREGKGQGEYLKK